MAKDYFHTEFAMYVFGGVLGGINGTVTASCASEAYLQIGEATLDETVDMKVDYFIHMGKEIDYFSVILKKIYHRFVKTCECLVFGISAGVVRTAAVEHITSSVAAVICWYAFLEREGEDANCERR